jgi:hypothetical protein
MLVISHRRLIRIAALLVLVSTTVAAHASPQEEAEMPDDSAETTSNELPTKQWYGAPMLVTDLTALSLFAAGFAGTAQPLDPVVDVGSVVMFTGLGIYALGGPIVHFTENQGRRSAASLGLRVVAPIGGMLTGGGIGFIAVLATSDCEEKGLCAVSGMVYGGLIGFASGMLAATILDNALLSYKPITRKQLAFSVMPSYEPTTGQTGLIVHGAW